MQIVCTFAAERSLLRRGHSDLEVLMSARGVLRLYVRTREQARLPQAMVPSDTQPSFRAKVMDLLTLVVAAEELRELFGHRLERGYRAGKTLFGNALRERRQLSARQVAALCDSLEAAGMLRFARQARRSHWTIDPSML
jgi:hypothetical protein